MTVSTTHVENNFTGNGVTASFAFTFQTLNTGQASELTNIVSKLAGVEISTSLYTVTLNADQVTNPGGSVLFSPVPGNGVAVKLLRRTPKTQTVDFTTESKLNSDGLEVALDKMMMIMQEAAFFITGPTGATGGTGATGTAGSMTGPGSATNNALVVFNGTSGNIVKLGAAPVNNGDILKVVAGVWTASAAAATFPAGIMASWPFDPAVKAVPSGWDICDGRTVTVDGAPFVTPDTRGKYMMGSSEDDTGSSGYTGSTVRTGQVAGTKTHSHVNGGSGTTSTVGLTGTVTTSNFGCAAGAFGMAINGVYNLTIANHSHTVTLTGDTNASTESTRPISYASLKIIKVD